MIREHRPDNSSGRNAIRFDKIAVVYQQLLGQEDTRLTEYEAESHGVFRRSLALVPTLLSKSTTSGISRGGRCL